MEIGGEERMEGKDTHSDEELGERTQWEKSEKWPNARQKKWRQ